MGETKAPHQIGNPSSGHHNDLETARRLATVPGIGPITASLISASVGDNIGAFKSARHFAAWLGLVPRHAERCREVGRQLSAKAVKFIYRNEVRPEVAYPPGELDCLLVNTTGELKFFYEHATVVFVGKSLTATGGQNPIEPGMLRRAMVFGPNMQNFADVTRNFVKAKAAVQVNDPGELEQAISRLLKDADLRAEMGRQALAVVRENQGAIDRTVEMILEHLKPRGIYIAPAREYS